MTPKHESETLMNAVLPVAERMLTQHGEFYPYGGCMRLDGSITHIGAEDADTDHPKSKDMLFALKDSLREIAGRGECKAVAVVFDVSISLPNSGERSDAIQVNVEHEGGYSVEVFFPYRLADGELIYGETLVQQGKHEIFCAA
ncbi:MAG: hypothetical protein JST65_23380 [Acidobacteria bacterium]|nr:hypothetical protein [Acidobacteriota bacterium]